MNKLIKKITYILGIAAVIFAAGCSDDIDPEITNIKVDRLFSPVDLKAQVVNKIAVRLEWREVNKAKSYTLEFFKNQDLSGTPVRIINGVTYDQVPYTVTGFDGESNYSVRLKAVGEEITESKWVSTTFKTDPEQIFFKVNPTEINAFGATLRWPAGEVATSILLNPGNISRPVTAGEIAAGTAVISGLSSETTYTAQLINNTGLRGTMKFTTYLDISTAIEVNPGDDLALIVDNAAAGSVLALHPGEYTVGNININRSISIKGVLPYNKPVITGAVFNVYEGSGLELKDLVLDGTGAPDGNQTIIYRTALPGGTYADLKITDCVIRKYVKGTLYVNVAALIENVIINGCIYHDVECNGGDFIDFRNGMAKNFVFTNNTAYRSALARDFFRMDGGGSTNFPGVASYITINNNTFNNVSNGSSRRMLYIRLALHEITFSKNILANTEGYYSNQAITTIVAMSANNYHAAPNFTASAVANAKNDPGPYTTLNPGFVNVDEGNFKVTNAELILKGIGDPRWLEVD